MNVLVLTSVYKDDSLGVRDTSTNIVNSFAAEWVKQGHRVFVIHNVHRYPGIVHRIPMGIKKKLATRMKFSIADYDAVKKKKFTDRGVEIYRLPIRKYLPHRSPNEAQIKKQVERIKAVLAEEEFVPDVITGHWASPQMEIIARLKHVYSCPTAVVLHGTGYVKNPSFRADRYLPQIDHLGTRSVSQAARVKKMFGLDELPFVCYSGVPDAYIAEYTLNTVKYENVRKWKVAFVGRLVAYKKVDATIRALAQIRDVDWEFEIVGDGAEREPLEKLCAELHCADKVHFRGRVSREEVMKVLSETNIFVMISLNEIFGLVYLEAMAASCLTIASKNGGVDGIIVDGENGFLCREGDPEALEVRLRRIFEMDQKELIQIAANGYETACVYSDSAAAKHYLDTILEKGTC